MKKIVSVFSITIIEINKNERYTNYTSKNSYKKFKDSGYKNCAAALAELIDNSIEAKAKNINILVFEKSDTQNNRPNKKISEIVICDDGIGMNEEILEKKPPIWKWRKITIKKRYRKIWNGSPYGVYKSMSKCSSLFME